MGSSACKALVFSDAGRVLAQTTCSYRFYSSHPSWAELPAEEFWRAFVKVTREVSAQADSDPIRVLAISSHGETFVPLGGNGEAMSPAILNMDNRAVAEARWIAEKIGRQHLFEITGLTAHAMYPAAKILWLRKNQPELFNSVRRFLAVPDYLLTRLGLPPHIDYSLASRFLLFDIHRRCWSEEILSACDMSAEQLPLPVPAGTMAGKLADDIASELGLHSGTLVVVGGHDQPCGALGSGVLGSGRVSASFGTYECLVAASRTPALTERALAANLNSYCHVVPERYVTLAYFPSGIMLDWFLRVIDSSASGKCATIGERCACLEKKLSAEPSGLLITPHLLGTCNPDFDTQASGIIAGIRPGTTGVDLYKGILEGIACEFASMCDLLQETAGEFGDVYISGGGSRSVLGLKLRAALSGRELHLLERPEAVCLGTAMLAGLAAGHYGSFDEAAEQLIRVSETIVPDTTLTASYAEQRESYRMFYSELAAFRGAQAASH
jgi:xylulokinase